jgi:hypothetical protein
MKNKLIKANDKTNGLSSKETRKIVTPYAFHVSPELFGTPLARPMRRAFAMSIDLLLIAMLTQVSSLLLAGVAAATFFRAGNRLKQKKRFNSVRIFLRGITALLLFVVALGVFEEITESSDNDYYDSENSQNVTNLSASDFTNEADSPDIDGMVVVTLTAKYIFAAKAVNTKIENQECPIAYECWHKLGSDLTIDMVEIGLPKKESLGIIGKYTQIAEETLSTDELKMLNASLQALYEELSADLLDKAPNDKQSKSKTLNGINEKKDSSDAGQQEFDELAPITKMLNNLSKMTEDLGLGFGWAIFYFSVFTAWWKGQTPGKRLMGIKVIKLDGGVLNLWESLGRYGGYSAGLATGLSGFLQVYWDPNRQAIQDKISETLVINLRKPKVPFEMNNEVQAVEVEDK